MENKRWFDDALVVNRDPDWSYYWLQGKTKEEMQAAIEKNFAVYAGHRITDVPICVYAQSSVIPSKYVSFLGDKMEKRKEFTEKEPYYPTVETLHRCFYEYGLDPVATFIEKMKEAGIRPWITLRMNDAHYLFQEKSLMRDDFHDEEAALGHVIGKEYGYYGGCYDFTYPRIREALLGFIGEIFERYDVFGLELDFQRELYCFDRLNHPDCHLIMTEFIRQVKAAAKAAEARVGHPLRLMIRTHQSPAIAKEFGFDIETMCKEGLIDAVVPTPRWEVTDSGIPVKEWRTLLGDDIAIFPGAEMLNLRYTFCRPEQIRAYAAAFIAQGADGFYLNNFQGGNAVDRTLWQIRRDNCDDGFREFTVTYQDNPSTKHANYRPLPMDTDGEITLEVGRIRKTDKVVAVVDFEGECTPVLTAAGKTVADPAEIPPIIRRKLDNTQDVNLTEHRPLAYDLTGIETECPLTLSFKGPGRVHYISIHINGGAEP